MNTKNRYLIYLAYFLFTIPLVIALFKIIEPKKLASLFAATLFISCSLLVLWGELKNSSKKSLTLWAALGFLMLFSVPMLIQRVLLYDLDFKEINFGPISGTDFHKYANYGFMLLMAATTTDYLRQRRTIPKNLPTTLPK